LSVSCSKIKGYLTNANVSEVAKLHQSQEYFMSDLQQSGEEVRGAPLGIWSGEDYDRPQWYALYTNVRHEKKVVDLLARRDVNCYLPLYRSVRRWQERRKEIDRPLFPGYVFIRIAFRDRLQVLTVPGAVHIVNFNGKPAPVAEFEVETLRQGLSCSTSVEPHPYLKVGKQVRVCRGPFAGMQGILIRRKDLYRLVLSVDLIMRSVSVEIDEADVEPAH